MSKLTKRIVDAAHPRAERYDLWDDELAGFGLRVSPSGHKSWFAFYRTSAGDARRQTIGPTSLFTPEQAREDAGEILRTAKRGGDPAAAKRAAKKVARMGDLLDTYERERVPAMKTTTQASERHLISKHVRPRFAARTVESVTRGDVAAVAREMRATPGAANKVLGLLSRLFAFAEELEIRAAGSNPCRGVPKYPEKKIERYLTSDERARLERAFAAAEAAKPHAKDYVEPSAVGAFRLLALTGMRLGEALDLLWGHVDLEHRRLALPTSKTGHKYVRLSAPAMALLEARQPDDDERDEDALVFATDAGTRLTNMQRRWISIRTAAKLPKFRIHDLRHAWASDAVTAGVPLHVVGKQLGHSSPTTTNRYAHLVGDVVGEAVELVGQRIADNTAAGNPGENVVDLPTPKKTRAKKSAKGAAT